MRLPYARLIVGVACLTGGLLASGRAAAQQSTTTWAGVFSNEQASEGEAIYFDRCAGCHQPDLSGGEDAPPLAGAQFGAKWNDHTLDDLFDRMRRLMPKEEPGSLTAMQYAQILAHLLHRNGFPAGMSPLSDRPDALKDIRFVVLPSR